MASNQYVNKVVYDGSTLIDLTGDTVDAAHLATGYTAHDSSGQSIVGAMEAPDLAIWQEGGYVHVSDTADPPVEIYSDDGYVVLDMEPPALTLQAKTYTVDSAGTETVTADSGYDGLSSVAVSVPSADVVSWFDYGYTTVSGSRKWLVETGYVRNDGDDGNGWLGNDDVKDHTFNAVQANTSVTPSTSAQTIGGANYMMEGAVTVAAMPTGTAGTPTATKSSVSNHSVSVTPSVTNQTGYITGSTETGTAVTVSASELVSGTLNVTQNGTVDVTNYASAEVNVSGGGGNSNIVFGDFTAGTASTVQTVTVPYSGNGYIIGLHVWVHGGTRDQTNTGWWDVVHQYATATFSLYKTQEATSPDYTQNNTNINGAVVTTEYKSSSSDAAIYSTTGSYQVVAYTTADPTSGSTSALRVYSDKVFKVMVSGETSGNGFVSGIKYDYIAVFSE